MSIHLNPGPDPILNDVVGRRLVVVAPGKAKESVALWSETHADGFMFNAYRGVDQHTMDAVLSESEPDIVDVFEFPEIDYSSVYAARQLRSFGVGGKTPWPDFSRLGALQSLWVGGRGGSVRSFPASLKELSIFEYDENTLDALGGLQLLRKLKITEAKKLASLVGMMDGLLDLTLIRCNKLKDISALANARLTRLRLERCRAVHDLDVVYRMSTLREVVIEKVGTSVDRERLDAMDLEFCYVRQ